MSNSYPLDPKDLKPIPNDLLVLVANKDKIKHGEIIPCSCYNAKNLLEHWKTNPETYASNYNSNEFFDLNAVNHIMQLVENYKHSDQPNYHLL